MTSHSPIEMMWDGEAQVLRPTMPYWARRAAAIFGAGEVLRIVNVQERSMASHKHLFAAIHDTWANLPPLIGDRFPTDKHLRKFALIKVGHCDTHSMPCGSPDAARKMAAFIRPIDAFSIVQVRGSVVEVFTAKSIAMDAADKKTFREVKDKVLDYLASMISVSKQELSDNAGRAA
jgi:hypothetical protein